MYKCLILICLSCYGLNVTAQSLSTTDIKKYNKIPAVTVTNMTNKNARFNTLFKKMEATVILFFSPDCDHCEDELDSIAAHYNDLKTINFLLISSYPPDSLLKFNKKHNLGNYKNINIYSDPKNELIRFYGIGGYPSMVIYDQLHVVARKYVSSIVSYIGILRACYPPRPE